MKYIENRSNDPSIIIGRFQNILEEINIQAVKERDAHMARRPTRAAFGRLTGQHRPCSAPAKARSVW